MHRFACTALVALFPILAAGGDPSLAYVNVLNGAAPAKTARDAAGNIYVSGNTISTTFPATPGAFQTTYHGGSCARGLTPGGPCSDGFVAKWDPSGSRLLWATYFGGSGDDFVQGMAVSPSGDVYLTGWTNSFDFPVTSGAVQTRYRGAGFSSSFYYVLGDAFVVKLNSSGNALIYSTYLGGTGADIGAAVVVDSAGNAYVTGATFSADFPVTSGALQSTNHASSQPITGSNAFIVKLNATGSAFAYSTYLGGSGVAGGIPGDGAGAIAVDASGIAYVTGYTHSTDFPTTPGAFQTSLRDTAVSFIGGGDAFLARISASGSTLLSSTYFGGKAGEQPSAIALDSSGTIFIAGATDSPDLPKTANALKSGIGPGVCGGDGRGNPILCSDAFVARFDPSGSNLLYATYLGGTSADSASAIAVDSEGFVYVGGTTYSADFPVTTDAFQPCARGGGYPGNAFVAKFKPGSPLAYSSFLGGSGGASGSAIAIDSAGGWYVTGALNPSSYPGLNDFPPAPVALTLFGATEASGGFVAMIDPSRTAATSRITCIVSAASLLGGPISPGELIRIIGKELGPNQAVGAQFTSYGALSTTLAGVQVLFNGIPAPLISVQSERIEAIVPYRGTFASYQSYVQVVNSGQTTAVFPIVVRPATPAIFSQDGSGKGQAAVLNEDGTPNSPSNPAAKGSVVAIYCTGLGTVTMGPSQIQDGSINDSSPLGPAGQVHVSIGGYSADVIFAGTAPGQVFGVFQINARVPEQPASGPALPIIVIVDGAGARPAGFADVGLGTVTVAVR